MGERTEDYRSARSESAEGKGIARRAWDAYAAKVNEIASPVVEPLAERIAAPLAVDLVGFWVVWHLEGGFDGLRRIGMSRASIYRRIKLFRRSYGSHPDEFVMPGVSLDVAEYHAGWPLKSQS
jgi:hypothetical protein